MPWLHCLGIYTTSGYERRREDIAAWQSFAQWTSEYRLGMAGQALLLQDLEQFRRLIGEN